MANTLGVYNPIFYAQEALILVEKALGMASRVHMGFDEERRSFGKGDVINIRKPSTFTAADAPATAADITTETVALTLNQWREVKFKLTDKELALTGQRIIDDHIRPAAYALADDIDLKLAVLYQDIPWISEVAAAPGSTVVGDITAPRRLLFDNSVPMQPGMLHFMIDGAQEEGFLRLAAFTQQQGAGDAGVGAQRTGSLGVKYGMELFANQNVQNHLHGDITTGAPLVAAAVAVGATTMSWDAASLIGDVHKGDTFVIAGSTQRYAVTAQATAASNAIAIAFTPAAVVAYADGDAVTVDDNGNTNEHAQLAFHRNAFALVTAPLSDMGGELGAKVATVQDPITGLSLRSRVYYMPNVSEVHVALDVLYGVKTLDPNLAVRARRDVV